jgi:hypothetical protein
MGLDRWLEEGQEAGAVGGQARGNVMLEEIPRKTR